MNIDPSLYLKNILPETIYNSSENFVLFLKAYYEWMNTSTFTISNKSGNFIKDETLVGLTSGARAKIRQISDDKLILLFSRLDGKKPFELFEQVRGLTTNATAYLDSISDNVLRHSSNLLDYRDVRYSVDKFSAYLKDELFYNLPTNYNGNKRFIARRLRDFYESKGHEDSYKFLMKVLYNQDVEISYPGKEILVVSDGKYQKEYILRTVAIASNGAESIFDFLFKTIRGFTSGAVADVVEVKKFVVNGVEIAEMKLSFVSGQFMNGENVYDVNNPLGVLGLYTQVYGVLSGYNINFGGSGYTQGTFLDVNGDGFEAKIKVSEIFQSGIDRIKINTIGHGYRLGTYATINEIGTGGTGLKIKVTDIANSYTVTSGANTYTVGEISRIDIVNTGSDYYDEPSITLRDNTIANLGLLTDKYITIVNPGLGYTVGDTISFSANTGSNGAAVIASVVESDPLQDYNIYLEDGSILIQELNSDYIKYDRSTNLVPVWSGVGPILKIRMTNFGSGYSENNLPTVNISGTGAGANLIVTGIQGIGANVQVDTANNSGGLGSIRSLEITDFGYGYTQANTSIDAANTGNQNANITPIISGLGETDGDFINDDGKISYKIIQDSFFYQKYSYVIKSGIEIAKYKDILKKLIHPAGLEAFGEIVLTNELDVSMPSSNVTSVEQISNIIFYLISTLSNLDVEKVDDISDLLSTLGGVQISVLADQEIFEFENETFASPYGPVTYEQFQKNIPISGTGSVYVANTTLVGNGTSFLSFFAQGSEVVVSGNKFIITGSVANGTLTETSALLNASPANNIINSTVYRVITLRR